MIYSIKTTDGKVVVLDTEKDEVLYKAPKYSYSGTQYMRGTDLLAHQAQSGKIYFYLRHWALGASDSIELISHSQAEGFLLRRCAETGVGHLDYDDALALNKKYGFKLYEETA